MKWNKWLNAVGVLVLAAGLAYWFLGRSYTPAITDAN